MLRFIAVAGGIFVSFFVFALLQERLLKGTYGVEKEKFTFILSLLLISQLSNSIYAYATMKIRNVRSESHVPIKYQFSIGLTYVLAMVSSFMALQWVSYPAQVLAKSAKPIPVLLMGVLLGNKSYRMARYIMVILVVSGVGLFMFKDDKAANSEIGFGMGELLLALSLIMDGLYNSLQERVMSKYNVASEQFMLTINKVALLFLGITVLYTGEIFLFCNFALKYPSSLVQVLGVSLCSSVGTFCIYKCITEFGTLTCSIVTTTRKCFTVLGSIVIFGHVLKSRQWFGMMLVFTGLTLDIIYGKSKKKVVEK